MIRRSQLLQLTHHRRGNLHRRQVRNHANLFLRLHAQTNANCVVSPRRVFRIKRNVKGPGTWDAPGLAGFARRGNLESLLWNTHYPTFLTASDSSSSPASVSSIM